MINSATAAMLLQAVVMFTTLAQGSNSHIMEPRQLVVRSAAEWQTLWKAHSPQPAPVVDFSRSIIVGVFLGSRPTAGYEAAITAVKSQGGKAIVEYVEHRPEVGAIVAQVLTSPFHLVSIPKDRADMADVDFRKIDP
jgi:hypothetical protein